MLVKRATSWGIARSLQPAGVSGAPTWLVLCRLRLRDLRETVNHRYYYVFKITLQAMFAVVVLKSMHAEGQHMCSLPRSGARSLPV